MFALAAAAEALGDAGWLDTSPTQREMTGVAIGSGMSCTTEVAEAGRLVVSPLVGVFWGFHTLLPPVFDHISTSHVQNRTLLCLHYPDHSVDWIEALLNVHTPVCICTDLCMHGGLLDCAALAQVQVSWPTHIQQSSRFKCCTKPGQNP